MSMNGIDISHWNHDIKLEKVPFDFCILKATEGTSYEDKTSKERADKVLALGKLLGFYHFISTGDPTAQADHFIKYVKSYIGKSVLVLDWEAEGMKLGVSGAKKFLDRVRDKTGIKPMIYMSKSVCRSSDWSSIANDVPLWVAQYKNNESTGYQSNPWTDDKGYGAWKSPYIFQYTSDGKLSGFDGRLDLNLAYMSKNEWDKWASGSLGEVAPPTEPPVDPPTSTQGKSLDALAKEVISGVWGNAEQRKKALGELYTSVQAVVNRDAGFISYQELYKILHKETLQGNCGNGERRKELLGMYYAEVQALINNGSQNPTAIYYYVQKGDSMFKIAQRYSTTLAKLKTLNPNINDVNRIYVGQKIRVK